MKTFFATQNDRVDFSVIDFSNTYSLGNDVNAVKESKDQFNPQGMVVEIEMDDNDVVKAVLSCLVGNSCTVRVKVLRIVHPPLPVGTEPKFSLVGDR